MEKTKKISLRNRRKISTLWKLSSFVLEKAKKKYSYKTPFTKESLLYRDIFEEYYPGQAAWIKDYWMPNKNWENCDVDDPSARVLKNYGDSGK